MPKTLLERLIALMPHAKFHQSYGLSELGVIKTKSSNSLDNTLEITDASIQYRIKDSKLEIKSHSSMLGYLNAPNPFTEDGWFITGDEVEEVDGKLRILGRASEMINVGGEKVFPAEIESVLLKMAEISDVVVIGEKNAILGNIVTAKVSLKTEVNKHEFIEEIRKHCQSQLPKFKVPQKFLVVSDISYGDRFKKNRLTVAP